MIPWFTFNMRFEKKEGRSNENNKCQDDKVGGVYATNISIGLCYHGKKSKLRTQIVHNGDVIYKDYKIKVFVMINNLIISITA